ncbi:GIY-YIG nuclease family protein [Aquimarina megaterium]|uniref:GIY-YIG nuclease family protein n=1 Tax=Aquimarina megaterium TaxID=1443666 RepID=UPI000944C338|nr:GIY-YIG nuclease family protein [Aquimarina megaterium]
MKYYYTYIVECSDGSFYTGMTNDLERRINEHKAGNKPDSYTYDKRPVVLKWFEIYTNPNEAIQIEKQVKGWSRRKKIALIEENWGKLVEYSKNYTQFGNNIDKNNGSSTGPH